MAYQLVSDFRHGQDSRRFMLNAPDGSLITLTNAHITSGGEIEWKVLPKTPVKDRVILVLDDILDQGHTLAAIRDAILVATNRRDAAPRLEIKQFKDEAESILRGYKGALIV